MLKIKELWAVLIAPRHFHLPTRAHLIHSGEQFMHAFYLGAVSVEAHGFYAYGAMGLLVFVILAIVTKEA